ncbi:MAG: cation transporter [Candidatus Omnitrophica bacterium]|nr:cation transporter [Candidatus Omnitrophota bacterium]
MRPEPKKKSSEKCEGCARKTIFAGILANLFLAAFKLFVGFMGRSRALIGSGLCNLSDVFSSIVVIIGVKYSKKPADHRYPYGYGKIEFIAQVVMSVIMILGTLALILSSFIVIAKRTFVVQHSVVFFVAILSAVISAFIYKFSRCSGEELNSPSLKAHAEHNKIDVISSLLVAIGVVVTRMGLHWVDPAIAIFECVHVLHASFGILKSGLKGIMDTNLPEDYLEKLRRSIVTIKGIVRIKHVRARQTGRQIVLDIGLQLSPEISVLEAKHINQSVRALLRSEDKYIGNIFIQDVPADT